MAQKKGSVKKVDFNTILCNFVGLPIKDDKGPVTLKFVAITALLAPQEGEQGVNGVERYARYSLAKRVNADTDDFTSQDIEKIKKLVGNHFIPLIVGAAYDALDGIPFPTPKEVPAPESEKS